MNTQPATVLASELEGADWTKSSYSNNGGNCVETAGLDGTVAVRDSKNPNGPALLMPSSAFESFITGIRDGHFDA
ncbi:DUF397 domain-containing protein [Streptomyces sp. NPDC002845]